KARRECPAISQKQCGANNDGQEDRNRCLYQHQPEIVEPRHSSKQTRGEVHIQPAVEIVASVLDPVMMEPMHDGIEVGRRENDRVDHNKGKEHHEEKPFVAEVRRLARQPHSSGKKPGECIQAKKVKNVLRGKTKAKADCAQVVPSPCSLARICLCGAKVEITSQ